MPVAPSPAGEPISPPTLFDVFDELRTHDRWDAAVGSGGLIDSMPSRLRLAAELVSGSRSIELPLPPATDRVRAGCATGLTLTESLNLDELATACAEAA